MSDLTGNLILNQNFYFADNHTISGGCYVGNNRMLVYFNTDTTVGVLKCFNLSNYTIEWQYNIEAYWGGNVAYNPNNNHAYFTAVREGLSGNEINLIFEIDLANPGTIIRQFSLPEVTQCMTLTYDKENDVFYSLPYVGTQTGTADMLYCFDSTLTKVVRSIKLKDFPVVKYGTSQQGLIVIDDIAYIITSAVKTMAIWGYDVYTGNLVSVHNIPHVINKCRSIGEPEHITYDYDNERVLIGSSLMYSGTYGFHTYNLFEVNLFKDVEELSPEPANSLYDIETNGGLRSFNCVLAGNNLQPSWLISKNLLTVPNDIFIYSAHNNVPVQANFAHSTNGVTEQGQFLTNLAIGGAVVKLLGYSSSDRIKVRKMVAAEPCKLFLCNCNFEGFEATSLASGYYTNIYASNMAEIICRDCTFASYSASGSHRHHLIAYLFSIIKTISCTFEGDVTDNMLTAIGGEIENL